MSIRLTLGEPTPKLRSLLAFDRIIDFTGELFYFTGRLK